jgi:hypothetical protein
VAHAAAKDAPQDVAAPFVRWKHAIGEQERYSASVIGEYAERGRIDRVGDDVAATKTTTNPNTGAGLVALATPVLDAD